MRRAIEELFEASIRAKRVFLEENAAALERAVELVASALGSGHKVVLFGNGGSAADAQHLAAEFTNRYLLDRAPLPAIALTTDSSALTSIANDFGYEQVFSKQVEALARRGDVAFAISTSGNAPNVLRAVDACRARGVVTVGISGGKGGALATRVDHLLCVDGTRDTPRIQETHIVIGHTLCELAEIKLAARQKKNAKPNHR